MAWGSACPEREARVIGVAALSVLKVGPRAFGRPLPGKRSAVARKVLPAMGFARCELRDVE